MDGARRSERDIGRMRDRVIEAALRYRDAMRRYMADQAEAMERGASLDDLVIGNREGFEAAARAEEELFALLDRLEEMQAGDARPSP